MWWPGVVRPPMPSPLPLTIVAEAVVPLAGTRLTIPVTTIQVAIPTVAISVLFSLLMAHLVDAAPIIGVAVVALVGEEPLSLTHEIIAVGAGGRSRRYERSGRQKAISGHRGGSHGVIPFRHCDIAQTPNRSRWFNAANFPAP